MQTEQKIWLIILGIGVSMLTTIDKFSNSALFTQKQNTGFKKFAKAFFLISIGGLISLATGILFIKYISKDIDLAFIAAGSAAIFARDIFYLFGNFTKSTIKSKVDFKRKEDV